MRGVSIGMTALVILGACLLTACGRREYANLPESTAPKASGVGTVVVSVVDPSAKPLSGARVALRKANGEAVGEALMTDTKGLVTLKAPLGGSYELSVQHGGLSAFRSGIALDSEAPAQVSVTLVPPETPKASIAGTVMDGVSAKPLDGATVSVLGTQNTVKAGPDGSFLLKDVAVGNPVLVFSFKGFLETRRSLVVRPGQLERLDLKLYASGNASRIGHTLVASQGGVHEVDRAGRTVWHLRTGAFQARMLPGGNALLSGTQGVVEVNTARTVVWSYKPLSLGVLSDPQAIWRTSTGNTWIADTGNNRVIEVSTTQRLQRVLKASLSRPMSVERLEATASTLIADTGNHRVIEVADDGRILWSLGDGTPTLLNHPTSASRLPNGNTLIADSGNHRVMEVNRTLQLVWMYGGAGDRTTCYLPNAASRLPNGNTLIADTGNDRVLEISPKATVTWQYEGVPQPLFVERL